MPYSWRCQISYNGSGTFNINSSGQPVVTGTVISSTAFNALTADLGTGLSTAITKDGQTTATSKIPFALGISINGATSGVTSLLATDAVTATITLPSATATLATLGANTFAGNQSITGTLGVTGASTLTGGVSSLGAANSFTGTLTGVTTSVTGTIYYRVIGDTVVLDIPLLTFLGTSNTSNCTITGGPSAIMPTTQKVGICSIRDNGTFAAGLWRMETTGVITFLASTAGDSFVSSGSKGTYGQSIAYTKN